MVLAQSTKSFQQPYIGKNTEIYTAVNIYGSQIVFVAFVKLYKFEFIYSSVGFSN